jgi:hypothetical protein
MVFEIFDERRFVVDNVTTTVHDSNVGCIHIIESSPEFNYLHLLAIILTIKIRPTSLEDNMGDDSLTLTDNFITIL